MGGGNPGEILAAAGEGDVRLHSNRVLLGELRVTLERPKFARYIEARGLTATAILADYRRLVSLTRRDHPVRAWSRDPDDDHVIACALAVRADFLVTGDDDLLTLETVGEVRIVSPAGLLRILA